MKPGVPWPDMHKLSEVNAEGACALPMIHLTLRQRVMLEHLVEMGCVKGDLDEMVEVMVYAHAHLARV